MRISQLSQRAGVPVGTIKFYLREGLLQAGEPTGRNQASYDERHLRRLHLIRALTVVARMNLAAVRELLMAVEDRDMPPSDLFLAVERALTARDEPVMSRERCAEAETDVDELVHRLNWQVRGDAPSRQQLVQALAALKSIGSTCGVDFFLRYGQAVDALVPAEMDTRLPDGVGNHLAAAAARAVLLEVVLTAMRRMAQEHHAQFRCSFGGAAKPPHRR
jgi:DNA-binding transcriptional MerR regulator